MDKKVFVTSQFRRTHNKQYENYVLTRIWHQIDSLEVKMVTQQYVRRKRAVWERTAVEVPTIKDKLKVGSGYKD